MPSRSRTSGSSSKTAGTRVTRSVWPAASIRRAASARASGSRSRPITRRPGWASSIASVWPARPRVASTRTAPSAAQAGASSSVTRSRRTGTCTGTGPAPRLPWCSSSAASRTVRGPPAMVPRAEARVWDAGVPVERGGADRGGWGAWGGWGGVGRRGRGEREWRRSRPGGPPAPRGPPGVGEERQVVPRGGGGSPRPAAGRRAPLRCAASVPFGTQSRGRRLGAGPGRAAGKAARSGWLADRPGAGAAGRPGITTTSASPRSPCRRRRPPARPRRPPSWRRPRSRSGCPRRR